MIDLDNMLIVWNNLDGIEELFIWILEMKNVGIFVVVVLNNNLKCVVWVIEKFDFLYVVWVMKFLVRGINIVKK